EARQFTLFAWPGRLMRTASPRSRSSCYPPSNLAPLQMSSPSSIAGKARLFWPVLFVLVLSDCTTKRLAEERLVQPYIPHEVVGDVVRFTLAYNTGAAFSLSLGPNSRWIFVSLTLLILGVLSWLYREAEARDTAQVAALALVCGGAIGNLLDRLRSPRGVVDFIDLGLGGWRFWTFNIADVAITVGAIVLAVVLWRREAEEMSGVQRYSLRTDAS